MHLKVYTVGRNYSSNLCITLLKKLLDDFYYKRHFVRLFLLQYINSFKNINSEKMEFLLI